MTDPLDDLVRAISASRADALSRSLVPVEENVPYLADGFVRVPATMLASVGDLAVPATSTSQPIDYTHIYMVLGDYIEIGGTGLTREALERAVTEEVFRHVDKKSLLIGLGVLRMLRKRRDDAAALLDAFRMLLTPDARARFDVARRGTDGGPHEPLARQPLLGAFRSAVMRTDSGGGDTLPPEFGALLLSHTVADGFAHDHLDDRELIGRMPAQFAVDMVTNHGFNSSEDILALLDRTIRLWRDFGSFGTRHLDGAMPADLLAEATGLEIEDLLAMAFAVWSHSANWEPGAPPLLNSALHPGMDDQMWSTFLSLVAATPDEIAPALSDARSQWDFLAFQTRPVLRFDDGLLLVDEVFLLERVTTGLYWIVHDHLKQGSDRARENWTHAWGDMVEALGETILESFAPPVFGGMGRTYFTEDDLARAYGDGRGRVDAVVDLGVAFGAFEIVSGQLTTKTRIDGDTDAFRDDLEKLLYKKIRQLDGTCRNLVENPASLTGGESGIRPVQPVVIAGGGLPVNPVTMMAARDYCEERGLLEHAMIRPLAVIDLGELEMLEGLREDGQSPADLLFAWQESTLANLSLRNWLLERFGAETLIFRPERMKPRTDALFADMIKRLGFGEKPDEFDEP